MPFGMLSKLENVKGVCVCGRTGFDDAGVTKAHLPWLEQGGLTRSAEAAREQHVETSIAPDQVECGGTLGSSKTESMRAGRAGVVRATCSCRNELKARASPA